MANFYANPYDTSASGFYFDDNDEMERKYAASRAEEFEIDLMDGYLKDFTGSIRPFIGGGYWGDPPKLQEARNAASGAFKHMQAFLADDYGVSLTKARKESPDLIDFLNDVSDAVKQYSD